MLLLTQYVRKGLCFTSWYVIILKNSTKMFNCMKAKHHKFIFNTHSGRNKERGMKMNIMKFLALGLAEKALNELDTVLQNASNEENKTESEKAAAAERAARRDEFFQKVKNTATNTVRKVQNSIEKREQEKQAAYEAEIKRLFDTYPIYHSFHFANDQWIEGAEVQNIDGIADLIIKTKCPYGKRMITFLDKDGHSIIQIQENDSQFDFGIFGTKQRETIFYIYVDGHETVTSKREMEKLHNVFLINEYGWRTEGKTKHLKIVTKNGEIIAERIVSREDENEMMMFFRYPETHMASLALFFVEIISYYYHFNKNYTKYYQFMSEHREYKG